MAEKTLEKETMKFDAEVDKIFQLMIHSIYENKDIFLRELISNASDACDKLRYKALTDSSINASDLKINISVDEDKKTINITDNGIGMSRDELIKNLGTIAKSGTQNFLKKLEKSKDKSSKFIGQLIGQFGVGFYSSFMISDKVEVISRTSEKGKAYKWVSKGDSKFDISEAGKDEGPKGRGTSITLHIKEDEKEFLDKFRLEHIAKTYSNHVAFDIFLKQDDGEEKLLNDGKALWIKPKSEITEEDYKEFYSSISHLGKDEPFLTIHNKVEGAVEYTNLLFIPSAKPFDLFHPERKTQVKLYVKRVFIAEDGIDIIPPYLRFVRGVVDSEDLPLNISRETVQNNLVVKKIKSSITKKIISELSKKADKDAEGYAKFWGMFGPVLKEGLCDGSEPRDDLIEICRFRTTKSDGELISLKEYKERMKDGQKAIYFITGEEGMADKSPQLEGFKKNDIEVLLLTDSVDEFWVNVLHEYKGVSLKSVTRASDDLEEKTEEGEKKEKKESKEIEELIAFIKESLGENVRDVKTTSRLTDSPVCLSVAEGSMDIRMERFLVENKQLPFVSTRILEINKNHPIIKKMAKDLKKGDEKKELADLAHLLFAQANIIEGEPVNDVAEFGRRMNEFLKKALAA